MTDPPRLFEATNDTFERRLLHSARQDRGTASAQARCVAVVSAATVAASKAGLAATASSAAAVAASAAPVGLGALGKAVAIGLTLGLAAQGSYVVGHRALSSGNTSTTRPEPAEGVNAERAATAPAAPSNIDSIASAASVAQPAATPPTAPPVIDSIASAASVAQPGPIAPSRFTTASASASGSALRSATETNAAATGRSVPSTLPPMTSSSEPRFDDSLEREVALLDRARQAFRIGEYSQCLDVLDQHHSQFPSGMLGPESVVIRVQALLGLGRRGDAETVAKKFMVFQPKSAAAKRLEILLGAQSK